MPSKPRIGRNLQQQPISPIIPAILEFGSENAWFNDQNLRQVHKRGWECSEQAKINKIVNMVNSQRIASIELVVGVPVDFCGMTDNNNLRNCTGDGYIPAADDSGNDMHTLIAQLESSYPNRFVEVMGWNFTLDYKIVEPGVDK